MIARLVEERHRRRCVLGRDAGVLQNVGRRDRRPPGRGQCVPERRRLLWRRGLLRHIAVVRRVMQ